MTVQTLTSRDVPALAQLLEQQCQLYTSLTSLSRQQSQLICEGMGDTDAPEQLLRLLAQRQRIIDELTAVHERLAPWRAKWNDFWSKLSLVDQQRIGPMVKQVETMLAQIVKQDEVDRRTLEAARNRVGTQMKQLTSGGGAIHAYRAAQTVSSQNRFTNQQG